MYSFAELLLDVMKEFPQTKEAAEKTDLKVETYASYYGKRYADSRNRIPDIGNIRSVTGWEPRTSTRDILRNTLEYVVKNQLV